MLKETLLFRFTYQCFAYPARTVDILHWRDYGFVSPLWITTNGSALVMAEQLSDYARVYDGHAIPVAMDPGDLSDPQALAQRLREWMPPTA